MSCFTLEKTDGVARAGVLHTAHGDVPTPAFMPVGTKATVKSVDPDELRALGTRMLLGNTYHLHFRPGEDVIAELGGLHAFMGWDGPILTDSGGFQVFSLRDTLIAADDDGVTFRSVYDGAAERFTPELAARIQADLGSDVAMCLDICPPAGVSRADLELAVRRTTLWAERQRDLPRADGQLRFAITQGGLDGDLRAQSSEALVALDFDGYAIGGLSVGEERAPMFAAATGAAAALPRGQAALLHGHRRSRGRDRGDRARHRHVRLRAPDTDGAHRQCADVGGTAEHAQRAFCPRPASAGRGLRLPGLHALQPRVHPSSRQPGGDPRPSAAQSA